MEPTIDAVKTFWESNPLWTGESAHQTGTRDFFEEHRKVYIEDCFAGSLDPRIFPDAAHQESVLDLGCGPGFWVVELARTGCRNLSAADLTQNALELTRCRCDLFGIKVDLSQQNAESLTFADHAFSHVNCQGVIHHTPRTEIAVSEIARVLKPGGTASLSVYYRNLALKSWPITRGFGKALFRLGAGMKGRGREKIFSADNVDEIVRFYDGVKNPIGKSYTRGQLIQMLEPFFEIREIFFHFFPARAFPWRIPRFLHRGLDQALPFMIYANVTKR